MNSQPKTAFDLRPKDTWCKEMDELVKKFSEMKIEDEKKETHQTIQSQIVSAFLLLDSFSKITSLFY